ncbi:hypothetical protein [Microbacterium hydrothermale]|uniref:hypothetical protein n=1 Tax=Microbacterium hydrothermale TaxID=857427 RepID=UPI0010A9022C|nr:hypothetical protein [Microbacterium hydrothermale]
MTMATKLLHRDAVSMDDTSVRVTLGLPWYRSIPWAGVASLAVEVDGRDLGPVSRIDGRDASRLSQRGDYWSIQRWAELQFALAPWLRVGVPAVVRARIGLRIPGPLQADGSPLPVDFEAERLVVVLSSVDSLEQGRSSPPRRNTHSTTR